MASRPEQISVAIKVLLGAPTLSIDGKELWAGEPDRSPAAYLRALSIATSNPTNRDFAQLIEDARRSRPRFRDDGDDAKSDEDRDPQPVRWRRHLRTEWQKKHPLAFGFPEREVAIGKALWAAIVARMLPSGTNSTKALGLGAFTAAVEVDGDSHRCDFDVTLDVATVRDEALNALSADDAVTRRIDRAIDIIFQGVNSLDHPSDELYRGEATRSLIAALCDGLDRSASTLSESREFRDTSRQAAQWLREQAPHLGRQGLDEWKRWKEAPLPEQIVAARGGGAFAAREEVRPRDGDLLRVFTLDVGAPSRPQLRAAAPLLGVQLCTSKVPALDRDGLSEYVRRPVDDEINQALEDSLSNGGGLRVVLVVGPSISGKTRAVINGLANLAPPFRLVSPMDAASLEGWLSQAAASPSTHLDAFWETRPTEYLPVVLFLDQLERFVPRSGTTASWLTRLHDLAATRRGKYPVVLIATAGGSGVRPLDPPIADLVGIHTERFLEEFDALGGAGADDEDPQDVDDATIFNELRGIYFEAAELEALNEAENLLSRRPDDEAELEHFQALLMTLTAGPDVADAPEDGGEVALVEAPARDVFDQAADLALEDVVDGAVGFGNGLDRLWAGARQALRQATYWKMKKRAGIVGGGGVAALVGRLAAADPDLRIHLVGHSFGARLVSYAVWGLHAAAPGRASPVKSLTLLQGAFSHYAFSPTLPHDPRRSGGLVDAVARVDGPILATHSLRDLAVGRLYPWAAAAGRDDAAALDSVLDRWGAIGHDGAQDADAVETGVRPVGEQYGFEARRIHNLDANDVIVDGEGMSGAHSDIFHPELAWAVLDAARLTG